MFEKLKKSMKRNAEIRRARSELHSMTNRDLADIGISRHDIERVIKDSYIS